MKNKQTITFPDTATLGGEEYDVEITAEVWAGERGARGFGGVQETPDYGPEVRSIKASLNGEDISDKLTRDDVDRLTENAIIQWEWDNR